MNGHPWLLLDTETTGFKPPIYVVELAAQRMRGWQPEGPAFCRLLNHGVEIPPEAARVNGYTHEILERDGEPPLTVYAEFADYAANHPLVAYNLQYDLEQVLRPEWQRLGLAPIGQAGFCALRLAQRLLDPVPAGNCKLQTLRQYYRLPQRGAHTALGDVETVADLMQQVLRPLAHERGLDTWDELCEFTAAPWYPSRIAFGKYKGRLFRDALDDPELHAWLKWLAKANNPRSAAMGRWYLEQLDGTAPRSSFKSPPVVEIAASDSRELVIFHNPELKTLRQLIAHARTRLAELEADYTQIRHQIEVVQADLFRRLRPHYQRRDTLRLKIQYRQKFLDVLLIEGEEEAETAEQEYQDAHAKTEREYQEATTEVNETKPLQEDEKHELKTLFKKLARCYHPDRYASQPDKQPVYEQLMQTVNQARDCGDIKTLREIAKDPNDFLLSRGLTALDFSDEAELNQLRRLYDSLQARILSVLDDLETLRDSSGYALYQLSRDKPEFIEQVAAQQAEDIAAEIAALEDEAERLQQEIEGLTGTAGHC
jgi:DNA polymerase-3 subunit epsilon